MRVECAACGQFVDVGHVPTPCPKCGVIIEDLNPRVLVYRPGGFRLERQGSEPLVDTTPEGARGLDPMTPNPYPIHRDPPPVAKRTIQIAVAVALCLIVAYIIVDYVRLKSVAMISRTTQPATQALAKNTGTAPPIAAPTPPATAQPSPPSVAPEPPQPVATTAPVTPPPAVKAPAPVSTQPAGAPRLQPFPAPVVPGDLTDADINNAIQRGVGFLISEFNEQGQLDPAKNQKEMMPGRHALATLALIHSGQATVDERLSLSGPFMTRLIEQLKSYQTDTGYDTYSRALRLMALALPNRQTDRPVMQEDLEYLMKAVGEGAYTYTNPPGHEPGARVAFDNSNSQYGALGAWAGADSGLHIPAAYWRAVQTHWTNEQTASGGWSYHGNSSNPTLTMSSAGVTMLFVAHDQLITDRSVMLDQAPYSAAIEKGLTWLGTGDNCMTLPGDYPGYALYGLERAGLASGFKRFGKHDWFRAHAGQIIQTQDEKTGAWTSGSGGPLVETAFRLLFLARGRHPLVMNKLRFDGAWANRPRDLVRLTEFVFDSIERPVNWQVAALENDWSDWTDSPILYIASHEPANFTDEQIKKLRKFSEAGGLLFTHADADSRTFNQFAEEFAKRLFPDYPMQDLPETHEIYSTLYSVRLKLPLRAVSNGARLLLIHSPTDMAAKWQFREPEKAQPQFELGVNIVVYATGKHPLRNRLDLPYLAPPTNAPIARVSVARLQHAGNWNPEPGAWDRYVRWFQRANSVELTMKVAEPTSLKSSIAPVTHLTTIGALALTDEQLKGLAGYVEAGGVLIADVCGGSPDAVIAVRAQLIKACGEKASFQSLADDHPLLNASGDGMINLGKPRLRVYAVGKLGVSNGPTPELLEFGKGAIILSPLDITSGLLDTTTWGILGYEPTYAQGLMNNAILWAVNGRGAAKTWTTVTTQPTATAQ